MEAEEEREVMWMHVQTLGNFYPEVTYINPAHLLLTEDVNHVWARWSKTQLRGILIIVTCNLLTFIKLRGGFKKLSRKVVRKEILWQYRLF